MITLMDPSFQVQLKVPKYSKYLGYKPVTDASGLDYGIKNIDHCVGNVYSLEKIIGDLKSWTGLHTFAKFTKDEIQTKWTSLNSEVLANNNSRSF
jgi:hypothetical protein